MSQEGCSVPDNCERSPHHREKGGAAHLSEKVNGSVLNIYFDLLNP